MPRIQHLAYMQPNCVLLWPTHSLCPLLLSPIRNSQFFLFSHVIAVSLSFVGSVIDKYPWPQITKNTKPRPPNNQRNNNKIYNFYYEAHTRIYYYRLKHASTWFWGIQHAAISHTKIKRITNSTKNSGRHCVRVLTDKNEMRHLISSVFAYRSIHTEYRE